MITSINYSFNEILNDKELNEIRITQVPKDKNNIDELAQFYANNFNDVRVASSSATFFSRQFDFIVLVQDLPKDIQEVLGEEKSIIILEPKDMLMEAKSNEFFYICKVTKEEVERIKSLNKQHDQNDE